MLPFLLATILVLRYAVVQAAVIRVVPWAERVNALVEKGSWIGALALALDFFEVSFYFLLDFVPRLSDLVLMVV